jgi:hypothetical protein
MLDVLGAVGVQALHGHAAAEPLVLAQEDRRHAARSEVSDHPVTVVKQ